MTLPLLLEPEELLPTLHDEQLIIIDLGKESVYQQVHIPGAIWFNVKRLSAGEMPAPGKLPRLEHLNETLSSLGIDDSRHVVVYDDEGGAASGRFIWTLDVLGHTRYSVINGGIHAWLAAGLATENTPRTPTPRTFTGQLQSGPQADKAYILAHHQSADHVIWDARSPEEYQGTMVRAQRSGHIPGAQNYEWTRAIDRANALRLRPLDDVRRELAALGISADKTIITHCQTHHRSGFTYLLGKLLGFPNMKAYDGSWSEWGNDTDTPIER